MKKKKMFFTVVFIMTVLNVNYEMWRIFKVDGLNFFFFGL